jgi:uncharacterized protein YjbI with pentapeptide repeats
MTKIINYITKETIIEDENLETTKELVEKAVKEGISLQYADLRLEALIGADLRNSDLRNSDLIGSNLEGSDLRNCDLTDADLEGAYLGGCKFHKDQLKDLLKGLKIKVMKKKENDNT